ncbi:5799_t:CDS:2 [Ambispora gerdemannii]|uniref:5799_t:CDS:1 n=1 Tax=Ambispora gerdemannii TaxID=144530 RepID=A0A9N9CRF9_9GLOM|nr:5799_t:CDS:2 [Ambispora gerdemannii]
MELGLNQALIAVKHRGQTVPLDGLYSILGLLPYGNKVEVNYKKELNIELKKIMELAMANGAPYECLSWLGARHINPKCKVSATGWELVGYKYLVTEDDKKTGEKIGDIRILPNYNFLEITLPVADKATRPIVFEDPSFGYDYDDKLFLDMVNKELITGEELITQYQQQLPVIQRQNQSFSLVYDKKETSVNIGKHAKIEEKGKLISAGGNAFNSLTFGIIKALGEAIQSVNVFSKRKLLTKLSGEFQKHLATDEANLKLFANACFSLVDIVKKNKELGIGSDVIGNNWVGVDSLSAVVLG